MIKIFRSGHIVSCPMVLVKLSFDTCMFFDVVREIEVSESECSSVLRAVLKEVMLSNLWRSENNLCYTHA